MAGSEQSIRVSARGEFGQLQRGLKDLQGDLKNVVGEIDKGARKGGIFDDGSLRALELFKKRLKDTMGELDKQFDKQNNEIDKLYGKMNKANIVEKGMINEQIKAREKELDVIRKQLLTMEEMYKKRTTEASSYEIKPNKGSSSSSSAMVPAAMSSVFGKAMGVVGTVGKFALGLAGLSSIVSLGQKAYQLAYERQVESLDLAQRLRGNGFSGNSMDMYNQVSNVGLRDNMGYGASESWAMQNAYTSKAGALGSEGQFALQKFSRGFGLDATQVADTVGGVKQLGGITQPKQFADMIAGSVSQSGMVPRILEVMQAHTGLLQNINTTFKDGSSSQILAYQTTLDKLGVQNGMTKLTGQQGANVIQGLGGIFQPNSDKWKWQGIAALQHYKPDKYGSMGLYDLEGSFEQGLNNEDNLPAMSRYMKEQSGGNNQVFKRLMQSWLQDGGFNATKGQVDELDKVTNGFTAFDNSKIDAVMKTNANTDSGAKYDTERSGEEGQRILQVDAKFDNALAEVGEKYLLKPITDLKEDFTGIMDAISGGGDLGDIWDSVKETHPILKGILAAVAVSAGISAIKGGADILSKFKGAKGAGSAVDDAVEAVAKKPGMLSKVFGKGGTISNATTNLMDKFGATKIGESVLPKLGAVEDFFRVGAGKTAGKVLSKAKVPLIGGLIDFGINKLSGQSTGESATRAVGSGLGGWGGAAGGAALGTAIFPGVGTILGGLIGGVGGGLLGDKAGSGVYDYFFKEKQEKSVAKTTEAASLLSEFSKNGTLDVEEFSTYGLQKLTEMRDKGLLSIGDFSSNGSVSISSLSEEGARELLNLQKNGSLSLTSMETDTADKLQAMKNDTSDKMGEVVTEHKSFLSRIGGFFGSIGDWFKDKLGLGSKSDSGTYTGKGDVRNMSGISGSELDSKFGGALKGHGADFVAAGEQYGIDPAFLAAVAMHETGNGTSSAARNKNNVGGMMGKNGLMTFDSIEEGINAMASNLERLYINQGLTTPEEIQAKYAPIGASNDPTGLNNNWTSGVSKYWSQFGGGGTGKNYSGDFGDILNSMGDSSIGTEGDFFNNWKSKITSAFGANRGDHKHGGLDIDGQQGDILNALKGGKVSFLYMDDGGKYDSDGKKNTRAGGTEMGVKMPDGSTYFYSHMSNVNPDILKKWQNGDRNIGVDSGDWLGNLGGDPGKAGSGYSTTGSHLHLGYMNATGELQDPKKLLNSMDMGDSSIGTMQSSVKKIEVDVNIKGEGAAQLNKLTLNQMKALIQQTVADMQRQKLAMNPTARG